MNILGISPLDKDATVSLVVDGQLTWAIAEERLSRQKMHSGFPRLALQMVLDRAGLSAEDIDQVVYAFQDCQTETLLMRRNVQSDWELNRSASSASIRSMVQTALTKVPHRSEAIPGIRSPNERMEKPWYKRVAYHLATGEGYVAAKINARQFNAWLRTATEDHRRFQEELLAGLEEFGLQEKLTRKEHHLTHVANAYYCSGFDQALVVTIDAYGSGLSGTVSTANREEGIRRLAEIETPYSLGVFYETVTSALGFRPDRHAGKIVGLAAYGDPGILGDVIRSLFVWDNSRFRMRRSSDLYLGRYLAGLFPKIDVAAAYQSVLEEVVVRHVSGYVKQTGADTVVLSGGVTANVKLNQRIHEIPGVRNVYVHPNMGDGGCGTGAALLAAVDAGLKPQKLETCYLGPDYTVEEMESALKQSGVEYEHFECIEAEIARLIADDNVVARFNGRMEYGPRALGNRSILYPAKDPAVNQWLNERLGRTEFMPFAPATLYEAREKCYQDMEGAEFTSLFMTITFNCTPWMRENCPAAVHIDGTARPQLVTAESNLSFYTILQEYEKLTGIPSVINTSFNMHEEPIVCSPQDAIRAFQLGKLDYLALGPFLVASADRISSSTQANAASSN